MNQKPIHWPNVLTLFSVAVLVGTEFVGTGWAAGWALGGLFGLGDTISHVFEIVFILIGVAALVSFMRAAARAEPIRL
jgi:hypothetical protein